MRTIILMPSSLGPAADHATAGLMTSQSTHMPTDLYTLRCSAIVRILHATRMRWISSGEPLSCLDVQYGVLPTHLHTSPVFGSAPELPLGGLGHNFSTPKHIKIEQKLRRQHDTAQLNSTQDLSASN